MLKKFGQTRVIEVYRRRHADARRAGVSVLGGDENYAVRSARSVKRGSSGSLQDLDVLDIRGIDVCRAVWRRYSALAISERSAVDGERRGRNRLVVDRLAVDDEQRLVRTRE